jgi:hypothetical protein
MDALNQFSSKKTSSKTEHICFTDKDGAIAPLVTQAIGLSKQIETLEGQLKDAEGIIKERGLRWFFEAHEGKSDIPSSIKVKGSENDAVLLSITSRYTQITVDTKNADRIDKIRKILDDQYDECIDSKFALAIDGSNIPEENREGFLNALVAVSKVFCHAPVEKQEQDEFLDVLNSTVDMGYDHSDGEATNAITAKQTVLPNAGFHKARHKLLTPAKNVKLHESMACVVSVKKKGVKA